jgi:hypothetical protein
MRINAIGFATGYFVGALASTFILIRGISWLSRKIGQDPLGLAHLITFAVAVVVGGYGFADGGEPQFVRTATIYGPACLAWFVIDLYRSRRQGGGLNRFVKYGAYVVVLVVSFGLAHGIGEITGKYIAGQDFETIVEAQRITAAILRNQLPIKVDEITTLQSVSTVGKTLQYHFKLEAIKDDIDVADFHKMWTTNLKTEVCQNESMRYVVEQGGQYKYIYTGSDGVVIDEITMDLTSC